MSTLRKPRRRRPGRALWREIHLWLGLTLGVVGALLGLSGSLLVYDDAIDAWLHPQRHAITGVAALLPVAEYAKRAEAALANGSRATGVRLPDLDTGAVMVFARAPGEGTAFQRVYLDPPTGDVLDIATGRDFLGWLHSFHESLTLREFYGREMVGVVGLAMLVSTLTGLYLWWPAGGWRHAVVVFRRGFGLNRNLHYTIGFWGMALLALLSFTGIVLAYPDAMRTAVAAVGKVSPSPRNLQAPEATGRPMPADDAIATARRAVPDATVIGFGFAQGPRGAYRVNLRERGDTTSRSGSVVFVDPRTGTILQRTTRATRGAGDAFLLWQRILHEGGWLGPVGRFVTFAGGLMPPLLFVTGFAMWLRKRARRSQASAAGAGVGVARQAGP